MLEKAFRLAIRRYRFNEHNTLVDDVGTPVTQAEQEEYSIYKYGNTKVAKKYGVNLARIMSGQASLFGVKDRIAIVSSAYRHVPTASYQIARYFQGAFNTLQHQAGLPVAIDTKIHRANLVPGDYGKLSASDREAIMRNNGVYLDPRIVENTHLLVIDDIRITGSHEQKIATVVSNIDLLSVWFLYAIELNQEEAVNNPRIEDQLNHSLIKNLTDLYQLIEIKNFTLNARVCKFLLSYQDTTELITFLKKLEDDLIFDIYTGILADGYGEMPEYSQTLALIKAEFNHRQLVTS